MIYISINTADVHLETGFSSWIVTLGEVQNTLISGIYTDQTGVKCNRVPWTFPLELEESLGNDPGKL